MPWVGDCTTFQGYRTLDNGMGVYGDGSDGDIVVGTTVGYTANPLSLAQDMLAANLTVPNGYTVNANGYRIAVKGVLTNAGVIHCDGAAASGATAGGAGTSGTVARGKGGGGGSSGNGTGGTAATVTGLGGSGGNGGNGTGGRTGGSGGASTLTANQGRWRTSYEALFAHATAALSSPSGAPASLLGGSGGGGGGGDGTNSGGGGGGGAGLLLIAARKIVNTGTLRATGGAGANGVAGNSGGGGGGGGGVVALVYDYLRSSGTIAAAGGAKGVKSGAAPAADGVDGSTGTVLYLGPAAA